MRELSFLIELLLCYIRHVLKFALDFCFFEKIRVMSIPPTIFHLKILMVRLATRILPKKQRHVHTSCKNICTQMNIKQFFTTEYTCQLV